MFDFYSLFSYPGFNWGKNVVIIGVDNISSVGTDNKKKDMFLLDEGTMQRLDDTTITAEAKYSINFLRPERKFCLSLNYNGNNSFLFANATKIYQFKGKDYKIKPYILCLGNISKNIYS